MSSSSEKTLEYDFKERGPRNLEQIDWGNEEHRRIVTACLVQGVYANRMEVRRKLGGDRAMAPRWWEAMRFRSYAGSQGSPTSLFMVFELDRSIAARHGDLSVEKAPDFVVAVRGAPSTFHFGLNELVSSISFSGDRDAQMIFEEVFRIASPGTGEGRRVDVWLAGHSIGASIATSVGIMLAERARIFPETYLFNPPYLRHDPVTLEHHTVKRVVECFQKLLAKALHGFLVEASKINGHSILEDWKPKLYLNPNDHISNGFLRYFENRDYFTGMSSTNLVRVEENGHHLDLNKPLGIGDNYPIYQLPAGRVVSNITTPDIVEGRGKLGPIEQLKKMAGAHKLSQWWKPDLMLECKDYGKF